MIVMIIIINDEDHAMAMHGDDDNVSVTKIGQIMTFGSTLEHKYFYYLRLGLYFI